MAKSTIEKFIQSYLKNVKTSKKKNGYESWLRENGISPTAELSEKLGSISAEAEKNASNYSAMAEAVSDIGLKNSGYAKYLKESSRLSDEGKIAKAINSYLSADSENAKNYNSELKRREALRIAEEEKAANLLAKEEAKKEAERIKKENEAKKEAEKLASAAEKEKEENRKAYEKAMSEIYDKVKAEFKASDIADYEKAYAYAIDMGLSKSDAEHLAKTSTDSARNSKIDKVTAAILSKKLTMTQAKAYALALGLTERDANLLAEFAFKANESVVDIVSQESYLDYLKEQINNNK